MSKERVVLVVDDDPTFVEAVEVTLEPHNYRVIWASNGDDGLQKMRQEKPAMVILDVMMGYILEGVAVAQQMSEDPELQRVPILMASSIAKTEYIGQFPTDGYLHIDDYITKPFDPDDLVERVNRLAGRST